MLTYLFATPLLSSAVFFLLPSKSKNKSFAFLLSLLPLFFLLSAQTTWVGAKVNYEWFPTLSIHFHLQVDSLSLLFLYLTALVIPVSVLAVPSEKTSYSNLFFALIFLLQALLIGFFTARDLALFTIFWEGMLLPLYFIISLWGGQKRQNTALTFFVYMIAGSALMVAAVLALYFTGDGSFSMKTLAQVAESSPHAFWLCGIFLLAFAVKAPLFPFHAWLPSTYTQAPTAGTILLSALLSEAGIYGTLRVAIGLFPEQMYIWSPWLLGLAIAGVFYGALVAWAQNDFKRLLAYASFSHVNFIFVGLFALEQTAETGAILQAFNHGITITALFLVAGWLEERIGSTEIGPIAGFAKLFPRLCWLTLFFVIAAIALPGTNNFVGEFLIFFGLFNEAPWLAVLLVTTVILSALYMLRWMQKVYFGSPLGFHKGWQDIRVKELAIAFPLAFLIAWVGIYPSPLLQQIAPKMIVHKSLLQNARLKRSLSDFAEVCHLPQIHILLRVEDLWQMAKFGERAKKRSAGVLQKAHKGEGK